MICYLNINLKAIIKLNIPSWLFKKWYLVNCLSKESFFASCEIFQSLLSLSVPFLERIITSFHSIVTGSSCLANKILLVLSLWLSVWLCADILEVMGSLDKNWLILFCACLWTWRAKEDLNIIFKFNIALDFGEWWLHFLGFCTESRCMVPSLWFDLKQYVMA